MDLIEKAFRDGFLLGSDKGEYKGHWLDLCVIKNPDTGWEAWKHVVLKDGFQSRSLHGSTGDSREWKCGFFKFLGREKK